MLSRQVGEMLCIGDDVVVEVLSVERGRVKLLINAPRSVAVDRKEVRDSKNADRGLLRTKSQVLAERGTVVGCCIRHADNLACDCLELALPDPK